MLGINFSNKMLFIKTSKVDCAEIRIDIKDNQNDRALQNPIPTVKKINKGKWILNNSPNEKHLRYILCCSIRLLFPSSSRLMEGKTEEEERTWSLQILEALILSIDSNLRELETIPDYGEVEKKIIELIKLLKPELERVRSVFKTFSPSNFGSKDFIHTIINLAPFEDYLEGAEQEAFTLLENKTGENLAKILDARKKIYPYFIQLNQIQFKNIIAFYKKDKDSQAKIINKTLSSIISKYDKLIRTGVDEMEKVLDQNFKNRSEKNLCKCVPTNVITLTKLLIQQQKEISELINPTFRKRIIIVPIGVVMGIGSILTAVFFIKKKKSQKKITPIIADN